MYRLLTLGLAFVLVGCGSTLSWTEGSANAKAIALIADHQTQLLGQGTVLAQPRIACSSPANCGGSTDSCSTTAASILSCGSSVEGATDAIALIPILGDDGSTTDLICHQQLLSFCLGLRPGQSIRFVGSIQGNATVRATRLELIH
ncbi:MAG: hypothetical protein DRQ40_07735 [Gammaproteobacteria bacterium]|nr:MAG: hypothetical protein DRQ40_07735 [Gammaproteobacteria bacterium]